MGKKIKTSGILLIAIMLTVWMTPVFATPEDEMTTWSLREFAKPYAHVEDVSEAVGNMVLSWGNVTAHDVSGKLSIASCVDYMINGIPYHKMQVDDFWDLSSELDLPAGFGCYLATLFCIDKDGTASYVTAATFASTVAEALVMLPEYPEDMAVLGYAIIGDDGTGHDWDGEDLADDNTDDNNTIYDGYPNAQLIRAQ